jgi:hypothetical protein
MSAQAKKYLKHEIFITGISNGLFNALIAWLLLKEGPALIWGGDKGFVGDLTASAFILPFIIALIVISVQKRKLRKGKLQTIDFGAGSALQRMVNRLPQSKTANAFCFGIAGIIIAVPLPLLGFHLIGIEQIEALNYAIFKGIWAGLLSAILIVPMVMSALRPEAINLAYAQRS